MRPSIAAGRLLTASWCLWPLLIVFLLAPVVQAQPWAAEFEQQLVAWQAQLDAATDELDHDFADTDPALAQNQLQQVLRQVRLAEQNIAQQIQAEQKRLDTLGEPPAEGEPAEDPLLAQLRDDLNRQLSEARAYEKRMELVRTRAQTLLTDIASWQRKQMRDVVLLRNPPPLTAAIWRQAGRDGLTFVREVIKLPSAWWHDYVLGHGNRRHLWWLLALPLAGFLIAWPLRYWILRRYGRNPDELEPTYARRIMKAFTDGLANAIVPVVVISLVAGALAWQGVLSGLFGYLAYAVITAFAVALLVFGLLRAALSPHLVQWRVLPVEPVYIGTLLRLLALVLALLTVAMVLFNAAWRVDLSTEPLEAVFFLIQSTLTALALTALLSPRYWTRSVVASQELGTADEAAAPAPGDVDAEPEQKSDEAADPGPHGAASLWIFLLHVLRWGVWITPVLALAGYGRLAFITQARLVGSAALVGVVWLFRLALHEALQRVISSRVDKRVRSGDSDPSMGSRMRLFWASLVADVLVLVPAAYGLLLLNGIPLATLRLWTRSLLTGFVIGNFSITPSTVLVAVLVFAAGLALTSLFRRWLVARLLPNTRLDQGAQNSVAVGAGYVGVSLTLLLVVSALGIDMSRLTIVLGALSLGIGFGLQNLVQNFAAGILLLIERPIKVGDWVEIGGTVGTVRRISVRSTEIEAFDRSIVFVPNSDLTAQQVINRNHRNAVARLILPIQTTSDADPLQVERVLLDCASAQTHVRWYPESYVWFRGFAGGVLNFELRVYIDHTDYWVTVDNALHHAIVIAFRDAGITLASPQRDVRLHEPPPAHAAAQAQPDPDVDDAAPA